MKQNGFLFSELFYKMELLSVETLVHIFGYLPLKDLIKSEFVCWLWYDIVRSHEFDVTLVPPSLEILRYFLRKYAIMNYDLSLISREVTDDIVLQLVHLKKLNLLYCDQITDVSVSKLGNLYMLGLSRCYKITDVSVSKLGNIKILNLARCYKITDVSVSKLSMGNLRYLSLSHCYNITDISVSKLSKLCMLDITECENITETCKKILVDNGCDVIY